MVTPWQSLDALVLGASLWVGVAVMTPLKKVHIILAVDWYQTKLRTFRETYKFLQCLLRVACLVL